MFFVIPGTFQSKIEPAQPSASISKGTIAFLVCLYGGWESPSLLLRYGLVSLFILTGRNEWQSTRRFSSRLISVWFGWVLILQVMIYAVWKLEKRNILQMEVVTVFSNEVNDGWRWKMWLRWFAESWKKLKIPACSIFTKLFANLTN